MIDTLLRFASELTENPDQLRLIFLILVGAAIFLTVMGAISLFNLLSNPVRRRMTEIQDTDRPTRARRLATRDGSTRIDSLAPMLLPKNDAERSKMSQRLVIAGYSSPTAIVLFYAIKTVLILGLPILALLICQQIDPKMPTDKLLLYVGGGAAIGLIGPNYVLDKMVNARQKRLRHGFPDALDLLVVCIEAGLGLNAAINRVSHEIEASYPDIAHELKQVNDEIRAGVARGEALRGLYVRTGLTDIRGLVSLLTQSLRFGTSIADTLRIYAEEFRDKRMQKAEEEAAKIGAKLIFPLVSCMFPGFFLVAVGPAILRLSEVFSRI